MSTIGQRINEIKASLPQGVTLVAVSKFHPAESIREAYEDGQREFGESRANELVTKAKELPDDIRWHFIGHLPDQQSTRHNTICIAYPQHRFRTAAAACRFRSVTHRTQSRRASSNPCSKRRDQIRLLSGRIESPCLIGSSRNHE